MNNFCSYASKIRLLNIFQIEKIIMYDVSLNNKNCTS